VSADRDCASPCYFSPRIFLALRPIELPEVAPRRMVWPSEVRDNRWALQNTEPVQDPAPRSPERQCRGPTREPEPERPMMWRRDLAGDVRGDEGERKRKADLHTEGGEAEHHPEGWRCFVQRHSVFQEPFRPRRRASR
jgi:hypothetical protein